MLKNFANIKENYCNVLEINDEKKKNYIVTRSIVYKILKKINEIFF